ncbi:MAG TPA: polyhydroxyalkanoic acid system family protein [Candidatus Tectomicrobia bacterium]
MSLINLSVKHGRSLEEARSHLEAAVHKVHSQFRALIQQVTWSADRTRVRLDGLGFWVEMWVDALEVHVSGDLPLLGRLFGSPMATALQRIVQQTFQKKLP